MKRKRARTKPSSGLLKRFHELAKGWAKDPQYAPPQRTDIDLEYLEWLRRQPCCSPYCEHNPRDRSHPHHHRHMGAGAGKKAPDRFAMPLHWRCHRDFHDLQGAFRGWDRERLTAWQDEQVRIHRERWSAEQDSF